MSLVLLDTTVLSDEERSAGGFAGLVDDDDQLAVAAISIDEIGVGLSLAKGKARQRRRAFFDDLVAQVPVLAYDVDVAHVHRDLLIATRKSGRQRGAHDLIIAATARAHGRLIVTADRSGFVDLPGVHVRAEGE